MRVCALLLSAACGSSSLPAPSGLTAAVAGQQVTLTWQAVAGAKHYDVARGPLAAGPFARIGMASGTSYVDAGAPPGTASYYVVSANSGSRSGAQSDPAVANIPPLAPAGLVAAFDLSTGSVLLGWQGSAGAVTYAVQRKGGGGAYAEIGTAATTQFVDVSPLGGPVSYAVKAQSPGGESGLSNEAAMNLPPPKPALTATATSHAITLAWPDNGATSWEISRGATVLATVTAPGYTDTGLTPLTSYAYQVVGINAFGRGHPATLAVLTAPLGPSGVTVAGADSVVVVSWTAIPGATAYQVSRASTAGGPYTPLSPAVGTAQFADFTVAAGQTYFYVVSASAGTGFGDASAEASGVASGVVVTDTITFVDETGTDTPMPDDLVANAVAAVPIDGGAAIIAGHGTVDGGVAVIPGVPAGPYFLEFTDPYFGYPSYVQTDARATDLSHYWQGRADQRPADAGTRVVFSLNGLDPWDAGDTLEMFSYGADVVFGNLQECTFGAPKIQPNATTFAGTLDFGDGGSLCPGVLNDVSAADGDLLAIAQIDQLASTNGTPYSGLRKAIRQPLTTKIGLTSFAGAMTAPPAQALHVNYLRSQFAQYRADVHPTADAGEPDLFYVSVQPNYATRGLYMEGTPDLAYTWADDGGSTDIDFGTLTYGNPYAGDVFAEIDSNFTVLYSIPGATGVYTLSEFIGVRDVMANMAFADAGLAPLLSPARSVLINGSSATAADRTGVGLTPVISWMAPALGTPDAYAVFIANLFRAPSGAVNGQPLARIWTKGTSVQVPAGLLQSGQYYFAVVNAFIGHAQSFATPLQFKPAVDVSEAATNKFTP